MAVLLSAHNLAKSFGARTLFQNLVFGVEENQRIGLIGPNGAGKSTLMKIIAGQETPDEGEIKKARNLIVGYLAQNPTFEADDTIYSAIINASDDPHDYINMNLTHELIAKFGLDENQMVKSLSGGWAKRVALARELVKRPSLLLLDEPTNHLDVTSILWLEEFLASQREMAVMTVTHDRLFLEKTSDMIFDLDVRNPDGLIKFQGPYSDFLEHKDSVVGALKRLEQTQRNTLRRETEWLRRGAKARQTKQKARIERAGDLKDEVADLKARNASRTLAMNFGDIGRAPKKMIEAAHVSQKFGERWLFRDFNLLLSPGARIGIIGRNGSGKTTLIRTLIGELAPVEGTVFISDLIKISYFAQKKETLDPKISLLKTICPDGDNVIVQGRSVFAKSYLARFLFRSDQMDLPVGKLSGGEQSRLLMAKMMLNAESVLVLDEPTNDLDIATLDVLQESLSEFPGAVILVSHDRYFMDQVVNQVYAINENKPELVGFADYFQWEEWYREQPKPKISTATSVDPIPAAETPKKKGKLSYKEQRELDEMESTIEKAETLLAQIQTQLADPANTSNFGKLQELTSSLEKQQKLVDGLYKRWDELNAKQG